MTKENVMKQMQDFFKLRNTAQKKDSVLSGADIAGSGIEDTVLELADVLDELAESFTDSSAEILDLTADLRKELRNLQDIGKVKSAYVNKKASVDDDDSHDCGIFSTVIFAVPGEAPKLMSAKDALDQYGMDEMDFDCFEIQEGLLLHFMTHAYEDEDEITVVDPVYIARVDVKNNRLHEITAQDYVAAMDFLAGHMTLIMDANGRTIHGYVLPKTHREG
jgi:hypothetical protein